MQHMGEDVAVTNQEQQEWFQDLQLFERVAIDKLDFLARLEAQVVFLLAIIRQLGDIIRENKARLLNLADESQPGWRYMSWSRGQHG
jgi:hypothetical protein